MFCDQEVIMTIGGHADFQGSWGRGAEDETEGSKHTHLSGLEWKRRGAWTERGQWL